MNNTPKYGAGSCHRPGHPSSNSRLSFHDINEFLQILTLLHEGHANVLNGWVQLEEELRILNVLTAWSGTFGKSSEFRIRIPTKEPKPPSCLRTIAAKYIHTHTYIYIIHIYIYYYILDTLGGTWRHMCTEREREKYIHNST